MSAAKPGITFSCFWDEDDDMTKSASYGPLTSELQTKKAYTQSSYLYCPVKHN